MKSRKPICITAMSLVAVLAVSVQMAAKDIRYKLVNIGVFARHRQRVARLGADAHNGSVFPVYSDTATPDPYVRQTVLTQNYNRSC